MLRGCAHTAFLRSAGDCEGFIWQIEVRISFVLLTASALHEDCFALEWIALGLIFRNDLRVMFRIVLNDQS